MSKQTDWCTPQEFMNSMKMDKERFDWIIGQRGLNKPAQIFVQGDLDEDNILRYHSKSFKKLTRKLGMDSGELADFIHSEGFCKTFTRKSLEDRINNAAKVGKIPHVITNFKEDSAKNYRIYFKADSTLIPALQRLVGAAWTQTQKVAAVAPAALQLSLLEKRFRNLESWCLALSKDSTNHSQQLTKILQLLQQPSLPLLPANPAAPA
jgi:hypothetical protein